MKDELYKKVFIRSEENLPKKDEKYYFHTVGNFTLKFVSPQSATFRQIKKHVDYWLQPISQPELKTNSRSIQRDMAVIYENFVKDNKVKGKQFDLLHGLYAKLYCEVDYPSTDTGQSEESNIAKTETDTGKLVDMPELSEPKPEPSVDLNDDEFNEPSFIKSQNLISAESYFQSRNGGKPSIDMVNDGEYLGATYCVQLMEDYFKEHFCQPLSSDKDKIIEKQDEIMSLYDELKSLYEFRTPPELGSVLRHLIQIKQSELAALRTNL